MEERSKVYVKSDEKGHITRCDGGYTVDNIEDMEEWLCIDEGQGDKYNLCQSNYFTQPLMTDSGVYRYKLMDGVAVECTAEEIAEQEAALPAQPMSDKERIVELEAALEMLLSGVTE